jgi:hypothetical protein
MLAPWHEHSQAILIPFPKAKRNVVDRLIALVADAGRCPLVIRIAVIGTLLYPYKHAASLGSATRLDIAHRLIPEQPSLL